MEWCVLFAVNERTLAAPASRAPRLLSQMFPALQARIFKTHFLLRILCNRSSVWPGSNNCLAPRSFFAYTCATFCLIDIRFLVGVVSAGVNSRNRNVKPRPVMLLLARYARSLEAPSPPSVSTVLRDCA